MRLGKDAVLLVQLQHVQDSRVKREWLAGMNGFNFVFNLLDDCALKSQLPIQPINVLPLQAR